MITTCTIPVMESGLGVVVGVDPGSRKVAVVVNTPGSNLLWTHAVPDDLLRSQACHQLFTATRQFLAALTDRNVAVWVEEPVVGRNRRTALHQGQVHGVIMTAALHSGITSVYSVGNTVWKKAMVGIGNASKSSCRAWLSHERPELARDCANDADLIDAACIAIYGRGILARAGHIADRVPSTG